MTDERKPAGRASEPPKIDIKLPKSEIEHSDAILALEFARAESNTNRWDKFVGMAELLKGKPALPIVSRISQSDYVEWQGIRHPVSPNWAAAFAAMLSAKGRPEGITKFVDHTTGALKKLPPELREIVRTNGDNKGYFLDCF